jgi:hypothetical protein
MQRVEDQSVAGQHTTDPPQAGNVPAAALGSLRERVLASVACSLSPVARCLMVCASDAVLFRPNSRKNITCVAPAYSTHHVDCVHDCSVNCHPSATGSSLCGAGRSPF